ncbi:hypothetical protein E2929_23055 [Escherichia coli]|nr:hypothetical protein [Escherichia coli]
MPDRHRCQRYYRRVCCFVLYLLIVHIRCSIDIVGSPSSRYCRPPLAADHFAVANDLTDSVGMRQIARFSLLRLYRRQIPLNLLLFVGGAGVKTRRLF